MEYRSIFDKIHSLHENNEPSTLIMARRESEIITITSVTEKDFSCAGAGRTIDTEQVHVVGIEYEATGNVQTGDEPAQPFSDSWKVCRYRGRLGKCIHPNPNSNLFCDQGTVSLSKSTRKLKQYNW